MNIKYLTENELKYINDTLKNIQITKKINDIISKEIIKKKNDIKEPIKEYLIKEIDTKNISGNILETINEEFKKNLLSIMNLYDYEYIKNNNFFNYKNKKIFNTYFERFKKYIIENYKQIKKEDFIPIFKLFYDKKIKSYILKGLDEKDIDEVENDEEDKNKFLKIIISDINNINSLLNKQKILKNNLFELFNTDKSSMITEDKINKLKKEFNEINEKMDENIINMETILSKLNILKENIVEKNNEEVKKEIEELNDDFDLINTENYEKKQLELGIKINKSSAYNLNNLDKDIEKYLKINYIKDAIYFNNINLNNVFKVFINSYQNELENEEDKEKLIDLFLKIFKKNISMSNSTNGTIQKLINDFIEEKKLFIKSETYVEKFKDIIKFFFLKKKTK